MRRIILFATLGFAAAGALSGCAGKPQPMGEQECLARAMYFESNRSSEEGMVAVGTVVMNRVASPEFPASICAVVGQKNQFAPGALSRPMERGRDLAFATAGKVMRGARHAEVGRRSMFFHTAGYSFPYNNMHYVAIAGGNAFYEKRRDASVSQEQVRLRQANRPGGAPVAAPTPAPALAPTVQRAAQASVPTPAVLAPMSIEDILKGEAGL